MNKVKGMKLGILSLSSFFVLAACTNDNTTTDDDTIADTAEEILESSESMGTEVSSDTTDMTSDSMATGAGIENMGFMVSLDDAITTFRDTFTGDNINIDSIQFEMDDNRYVYSIDGWDDANDYELDIDAETGDILSQEQEEDTDADDMLAVEGIVSPKEAMDAALAASGEGYVKEWELEVENDQTIYDIDIEDGSDQKVDALTGDVLQ